MRYRKLMNPNTFKALHRWHAITAHCRHRKTTSFCRKQEETNQGFSRYCRYGTSSQQHLLKLSSSSNNTTSTTTTTTTTTVDSNLDDVLKNAEPKPALKLDPRAIFPWRHSSHPLPRLIPNTAEYLEQGGYIGPQMYPMNTVVRTLQWMNAIGFLGATFTRYSEWKREMEFAFQGAFAVAVDGMLKNVYKVDSKKEYKTEPNQDSATKSDDGYDDKEDFPIDFNLIIDPGSQINAKEVEDGNQNNHMIESALSTLYFSAHDCGKHKIQIKLKSKPRSAQIMSFFVYPFLTRKEVVDNMSLQHSYRNIFKAIDQEELEKNRELTYFELGNLAAKELDKLALAQLERNGNHTYQITIVAQVAIQCDEIFFVKDLQTNDIVQGDEKERFNDVTHLVRFELVVDMDAKSGDTELKPWQITDWDDLLDGNTWVITKRSTI